MLALFLPAPWLLAVTSQRPATNLEKDLRAASQALVGVTEKLEREIDEGKLEQANQKLLAIFPKDTRTPAQTLVLANSLYSIDPKLSYALHKQAAAVLGDEPLAQLEWAMEQHRAGDYAGAIAAYQLYSKNQPDFAPVHGLMADCLIRLGRAREAVAEWEESERARSGTLEQFESLVCAVHKDTGYEQRRASLCVKALTNVDAVVELVGGDLDLERDWWNRGPHKGHLTYDLTVLQRFPVSARIKAAQCAADCLLQEELTADSTRKILMRGGFLLDGASTLPSDGALLAAMLSTAINAELFTREQARRQFGERLRELARDSQDASLHNVLAYLYMNTDVMEAIERDGWDKTSDGRFAAGYLAELAKRKSLRSRDPMLERALREFPENSFVVSMAMSTTSSPDEALLLQAIKAEYRHFSISGLFPRPSARPLRSYFQMLAKHYK